MIIKTRTNTQQYLDISEWFRDRGFNRSDIMKWEYDPSTSFSNLTLEVWDLSQLSKDDQFLFMIMFSELVVNENPYQN